jgi:hypothetical protein
MSARRRSPGSARPPGSSWTCRACPRGYAPPAGLRALLDGGRPAAGPLAPPGHPARGPTLSLPAARQNRPIRTPLVTPPPSQEHAPESAIGGVGKVSAATLRCRRRSGLRDRCPPHGQSWSSGLSAEASFLVSTDRFRAGGHDPRAGARVGSAAGLARTCLVSGRAAPALAARGAVRRTVLAMTEPGPAAAAGGTGRRRPRLGVYQRGAGLLCAGGQQGSLEVQPLARAEYGGTSGCEQRVGSRIIRSGRPGTGGRTAVIPADHGCPVRDVRGRT